MVSRTVTISEDDFLERWKPFASERTWRDDPAVANDAVSRALVVGDIHNDDHSFQTALNRAEQQRCDVMVQVGDFWLQDSTWEHFDPGKATMMHTAKHSPIPVVVVDGNHEVWPSLDKFAETEGYRAALEAGKPAHLGGSLWWALRGSVWEWSDLTFGALGGAVSPDKHRASNRWPEEATRVEDLERLLGNTPEGGLDVLLTHDAPTQVRGVLGNKIFSVPTYIEIEADESRRLLARAVDETMPSVVVHGHWHVRNWEQINDETLVVGLSNNLRHGFTAVVALRPSLAVAGGLQ